MLLLHGTPGSRLGPLPRGRVLYELGVRLVTFDRPGYGWSDRLVSRMVADVVPDVQAIADALELDKFAVAGRSGGGPHALACAALLPHRVTRAGGGRYAGGYPGAYPFVGSPDDVAEEMVRMSASGSAGCTVAFVDYLREIPFFVAEVLPRLEWLGVRGKAAL